MIAVGKPLGWLITTFFALCFLVALLEQWLIAKPRTSIHGGFAIKLAEPPLVHWIRGLFWRKTINDLMAEMKAGKRSAISGDELDLAREFERRQIPTGLRFPKEGDIYEALIDFNVNYMTSHHAPFSGGGHAVLPQGERIRVARVAHEKPIGVCCDPLRYDELHSKIVSEEEREAPTYDGYYFSIDTVDLNKNFRLVAGQDITNGRN